MIEPYYETDNGKLYPFCKKKALFFLTKRDDISQAEVCEQYGRRWIGIELSQEYCNIAVKRMELLEEAIGERDDIEPGEVE